MRSLVLYTDAVLYPTAGSEEVVDLTECWTHEEDENGNVFGVLSFVPVKNFAPQVGESYELLGETELGSFALDAVLIPTGPSGKSGGLNYPNKKTFRFVAEVFECE